MSHDVAALEQREYGAHLREILAHVNHHRQIEGGGRLLCAPQCFEIVGIGDVFRQSRLDADDDIAMARDGTVRQGNVGEVEVVQFAGGGDDAAARDVHQHAADLRRSTRDGRNLIDVVCSARAGIDPARHAVLQGQWRPFLAAGGVSVDVDQTRRDYLAARIDRVEGALRNVGLYRHDAAAGDRHVADRVEPDRGIDNAPPLDKQLVGLRKRIRNAGEHRSACGRCGYKLTPVHHCPAPSDLVLLEAKNHFCPVMRCSDKD